MFKTDLVVFREEEDSVEVFGNRDGLPEVTAVVPAPDVNTKSEKDRQDRFDKACDSVTINGYYIVSKRRIKNEAFDAPGQKTTLRVVYRPCKTEKELKIVGSRIHKILATMRTEQTDEYNKKFIQENPAFLEVI
jgi:hypothetical protein